MSASIPSLFSRRRVLASAVTAGLTASVLGVAGCKVQVSADSGPTTSSGGAVQIPDPVGTLPSGDVTIKWLSGGPGSKSNVFKAVFPAYHDKHPNLTVQYDELPNDKITEVLPLQLRNGNPDDVFQVVGVPLNDLVTGGKLAALDDFVPDFANWKKAIPFGVIVPGVNEFDGKTYSLPASSNVLTGRLLLYGTQLMQDAGFDPQSTPLTLDDFRTAAKKITAAGNGKTYGFLLGGKATGPISDAVENLVQMNGGTPSFDWTTGRYNYAQDMVVEVIDLFKAMQSDGSFFPGWASLTAQQARAQMPLGHAGMMLQGAWNFPVWKASNPDYAYGVSMPPGPKDHGYIGCSVGGGNGYSVYAKAPDGHKQVAGDLFHFFGSEQGQEAWARIDGAADPSWSATAVEAARKSGDLSDQDERAFDIFDQICRLAPSPYVRNPDAQQASLVLKAVKPALGDIIQGYLTGQIADLSKALTQLNDASEAALDTAIATATKRGAKVSRDDWTFPNWDPSKDFGADSY